MRLRFRPRTRVELLLVLIACASCSSGSMPSREGGPNRPTQIPLTRATLQQNVGRLVAVQGVFSLRGVQGPFVASTDAQVYLIARGSFEWGPSYERLEGKGVRATGTLHFMHFEERPMQHPPDYFYFDANEVTVIPASR